MLGQLDALGYHTPWQVEPASNGSLDVGPATHEPIELFPAIGAVRIPPGAKFDPGGIGKGLAIDLVTSMLVANGATTTSVELGGDLRVTGTPWYGPEWRIAVADPIGNGPEIAAFTISSGAVATSSVRRRRWHVDGVEVHHLLDPATGRPAQTDLAAVSVCAAEAWWADVAAKVALGAGSAVTDHWFERLGVTGLAVIADGRVTTDSRTKRVPAFAGPTTDGSRR
jgi:thiamine biosynthesis lipoprotein